MTENEIVFILLMLSLLGFSALFIVMEISMHRNRKKSKVSKILNDGDIMDICIPFPEYPGEEISKTIGYNPLSGGYQPIKNKLNFISPPKGGSGESSIFSKPTTIPTKHAGNCHFYKCIINDSALDGICTCGYGLDRMMECDYSQIISEERLHKDSLPSKGKSSVSFLRENHSIYCSVADIPASLCHVCGNKELADYLHTTIKQARLGSYKVGYEAGRQSKDLENPNL